VDEFNDDVSDALGEIANMTAGSFKLYLTKSGADIRLSTPSVVTGEEYFFAAGRQADFLTLCFGAKGETFLFRAVLEK
jgi:chemotaxis protein CheX